MGLAARNQIMKPVTPRDTAFRFFVNPFPILCPIPSGSVGVKDASSLISWTYRLTVL